MGGVSQTFQSDPESGKKGVPFSSASLEYHSRVSFSSSGCFQFKLLQELPHALPKKKPLDVAPREPQIRHAVPTQNPLSSHFA